MTHAIFSGKMRILQHNTPPKRVRRFPARPRKNTPTRPHERPRRVFAWALPCPKRIHQTATPYSAKQSGTATISSMTIEPGSRRPRIVSARPQNQTDAALNNNSDPTKNAKLPGNSSRMNSGKPSNVPTVPGATGERPVPSPCAMRRMSLSTGQQSLRYTSRFFQRYRNPERAVSATATHLEISATHQAHT